jgi:hypothetical protein
MTKFLKTYRFLLLIFLFGVSALGVYLGYSVDWHRQIIFRTGEISHVGTLSKPDGTNLGDIYVSYLNSTVFTSLLVSKKVGNDNVVIYKINKDGFYNTLGKEMAVSRDSFYGYEFTRIDKSDFIVHLLTDSGKSVSDDYTITWNNDKNTFEIQRPHASDFTHE